MHRQPLDREWTLEHAAGVAPPAVRGPIRQPGKETVPGVVIDATVPGCVHTDLLRAGLIRDPYEHGAEHELQWIGLCDWRYACRFTPDAGVMDHERIDLVFDGIDTVAEVSLNGVEIGRSINMHHPHRFDVRGVLEAGEENELVVLFRSPVRWAEGQRGRLGDLPYVNGPAGPFGFIRKMACNFGWDWGAALATCGIWKGVRVEAWSGARIENVRANLAGPDGDHAIIDVAFDLHRTDLQQEFGINIQLRDPSGGGVRTGLQPTRQAGTTYEAKLRLEEEPPRLWWPRGYSEQPLYEVVVTLFDEQHQERCSVVRRIGLRTVELDTSPEDPAKPQAEGERFALRVNGIEVWCKGANWIPDDCFLDRACEPGRVRERIGQAVDSGMNMLRVWGGGIYETEEFYDICDELGVMVWQDFPFACAAYPEEEPFRSSVETEAKHNVARLSSHPSLVIWNGCNENIWGYFGWGWASQIGDRTWGGGYYFDLLPKICSELDPSRPYWPGSPYSGQWNRDEPLSSRDPNSERWGNKHVWEAWFGDFYTAYRRFAPRFCSEFGFQGPPTYATLAAAVPPDQLYKDSPGMKHRQKSQRGDLANHRHLRTGFDLPDELGDVPFDDYLYLLQVNQARALELGISWFRSRYPVCTGTLFWQLNDCWPVVSWAAVDSGRDGVARKKPLWYAVRRAYADRLLTLQPRDQGPVTPEHPMGGSGPLTLFAHNDTGEAWRDAVRVRRVRFDGETLAEATLDLAAGPRGNVAMSLPHGVIEPGDASGELLVADTSEGERALWFFGHDKALAYPEPRFEAALVEDAHRVAAGGADGGASRGVQRLTIRAQTLLRDLCIFADRLDPDAEASDQMLTLLPGESVTLDIRSGRALTLQELTSPPVLRCINTFGA